MVKLRFATVVMAVIGCGNSDVERLCDPSTGVWTMQQRAASACTADINTKPMFDADYMAQNCRATLEPLFANQVVGIATDTVIDMCRSALASHTCAPELFKDWKAATRICEDILVGTQQTGESCSVNDECAGPSYCMRSGTCGLCLARKGNAAACGGDSECTSGICTSGACAPAAVPNGGQCKLDAQCGEGLICRDAGHCEPLAATLGQPCSGDGDCGSFQSSCVNQVCVALAKSQQPCTTWSGGSTAPHCEWFAGFGCTAGSCSMLPVAAAGGACGLDVATCGEQMWCADAKCWAIVPEGGFCNVNFDCGPYGLCAGHACTFSDFNAACVAQPMM